MVIRHLQKRWPTAPLKYHKWIRFFDAGGVGHAEPEAFIVLKDRILLVECKLTGLLAGRLQMERLYKPLLEHIFQLPVYCLLICKNVTKDTPGPMFETPEDFVRSAKSFGVWHYLGE